MKRHIKQFPLCLVTIEDPGGVRYSLRQLGKTTTCYQSGGYQCPHCSRSCGQGIDGFAIHLRKEHGYSIVKGDPHKEEFWDSWVKNEKPPLRRSLLDRILP